MHKNRNTIYLDICPGFCAFSVHYRVEYKGDNKNSLLLRAKDKHRSPIENCVYSTQS